MTRHTNPVQPASLACLRKRVPKFPFAFCSDTEPPSNRFLILAQDIGDGRREE